MKFFTSLLSGSSKNAAAAMIDDRKKESKKDKKDKKDKHRKSSKKKSTKSRTSATSTTDASDLTTSMLDGPTPNEAVVAEFYATVNRGGSVADLYAHGNVPIQFDDMDCITAADLGQALLPIFESFTTLQFRYESIKEVQPGKVLVEDLFVKGPHNGAPYGFANFPPIPRTDKIADLGPERIWFTLNKEGKIVKQDIISLGNLTGPPGFYLAIGGNMDNPPPPTEEQAVEQAEEAAEVQKE